MKRLSYFVLGLIIALAGAVSAATTNIGSLGNSQRLGWSDTGFVRVDSTTIDVVDHDNINAGGAIFGGNSPSSVGDIVISGVIPFVRLMSNVTLNWGNGRTVNGTFTADDVGFARSAAGVLRITDGSTGTRGFLGGGASVASATAMPAPTGRIFHVTGTTTITSITSTNFAAGTVITIIFDGVLTFTDGSNLKLAGNFVTTADDTITLAYDGTNWYEVSRAVN